MPDLLEAKENGVTWLTLNRPERLNALSAEMTAGLTDALERLATDRESAHRHYRRRARLVLRRRRQDHGSRAAATRASRTGSRGCAARTNCRC